MRNKGRGGERDGNGDGKGNVSHTRLYHHSNPKTPLKPFQIPVQIPIPATYSTAIIHAHTTSKGRIQMGLLLQTVNVSGFLCLHSS